MENRITTSPRLAYLDSVRGIAALMVVFGHFINWKYGDYRSIKFASILFNGNDAVAFFFVLSGMVLSYPYVQLGKKLDIGKFYVNRIFRIFPAFWIALLINALYASFWMIAPSSLNWVDVFVLNKSEFWNEALLIRGYNKFYLPGWTLTIEICFSFLMPFLILIPRYDRRLLPWLLFASFLTINITGFFLFHFVLGIFLSFYFVEIQQKEFKQTWYYKYRVPLLIIAALFFSLRQIVRISPLGSTLEYAMNVLKVDFFIFSGLAAFIFLAFLIHFKNVQRFFEHPILLFYGRISYGIYLMHWVFVWAIGDYWETVILPMFSNWQYAFFSMLFLCFVVTTITATLLHYFVELPLIKIGKRVAGRMKETITI
ncbi:acyltransferase [Taibaiella lutea]|uniref:Acyltransferase n=1 Tax=Taibaiella lutea TaxID=2608001 RepID=A0A5M6CJ00_9BACT|nr:acyltransferase [Taibaiella lutea]KAA5535074.1 acyltransferase [Taibaiella lutea]